MWPTPVQSRGNHYKLKGDITMVRLTRTDLMKLSNMCKAGYYEALTIVASDDASEFEKALANNQAEYMATLLCKLDQIMDTGAKRVEIRL